MKKYFFILTLLSLQLGYSQSTEQPVAQQNIEVTEPKKTVSFTVFSITDQSNAADFVKFKEKYNVDIKFETCAVDVVLLTKARKTNKKIADLLTQQYGAAWMEELPCSLVGVNLEQ